MGVGPLNSSLLNKLGFKQAFEMSDGELQAIVLKDQHRRTTERAMGRLYHVLTDDDGETYTPKRVGRPRTKSRVKSNGKKDLPQTLEGFGLSAEIISKLRATGKPDWQLILELQGAGLI